MAPTKIGYAKQQLGQGRECFGGIELNTCRESMRARAAPALFPYRFSAASKAFVRSFLSFCRASAVPSAPLRKR